MTSNPRIELAGHVCLDLVLPPGIDLPPAGGLAGCGPMTVQVGGLVANTARALSRLGVPSLINAAIAPDQLGSLTETLLREIPLATVDLIRVNAESSSFSIIVDGTDRSVLHHVGANEAYLGPVDLGEDVELVHLGYPSLLPGLSDGAGGPMSTLLSRVRAGRRTVSMDFAVPSEATRMGWGPRWRRWAPLVDVVSPSLDDLEAMGLVPRSAADPLERAMAGARQLVADGAAVAMVTAGAGGMALCTGAQERLERAGLTVRKLQGWDHQELVTPAETSHPAQTLGAGDVASAALLVGMLQGRSARDALGLSRSAAAAHVRCDDEWSTPARPNIPHADWPTGLDRRVRESAGVPPQPIR